MINPALIPFILARASSGNWLIEPGWLLQNADTLQRIEEGKEKKGAGLKVEITDPHGEILASIDDSSSSTSPFSMEGDAKKIKGSGLTATVSYIGPVYKYGYWSGSKIIGSVLNTFSSEKSITSVRLILDSPGGEVSGTRELYQIIANYPKTLLTVVDGLMASAAYYLGSGAKRIVATQPTDRIGSLGTMATLMDLIAYYKTIGLDIYQVFSPGSPEKGADVRQLFESKGKDSSAIEASLQVINDQFLADVRAVRPHVKDDAMKGAVYYANEAKSRTLIDDIVPIGETLSLLSDLQKTQSKSTHNMSILAKMKAMIQAEESGSTDPSAEEQLVLVRADLATAKTTLASKESELSAAQSDLVTVKASLAQKEAELTTMTSDRDAWKTKAEEYGNQPGEKPTKVQAKADTQEEGEPTLEQIIAALPSEIAAAEAGY